jgi:hypothetical protein
VLLTPRHARGPDRVLRLAHAVHEPHLVESSLRQFPPTVDREDRRQCTALRFARLGLTLRSAVQDPRRLSGINRRRARTSTFGRVDCQGQLTLKRCDLAVDALPNFLGRTSVLACVVAGTQSAGARGAQ